MKKMENPISAPQGWGFYFIWANRGIWDGSYENRSRLMPENLPHLLHQPDTGIRSEFFRSFPYQHRRSWIGGK